MIGALAARNNLWSWILSSGKEKASRCLEFMSSTKNEIRHFHVVVVQWRKEMYQKNPDTRAKLLFCQYKPMTFSLLLPLLSSILSSLFKKLVRDLVEAAKCIGVVGFTISLLLIIQQVY